MSEQNPDNERTKISVPLDGCLKFILLAALAGIAVKECQRADIRLKREREEYERFHSNLSKYDIPTKTFVVPQNNTKAR